MLQPFLKFSFSFTHYFSRLVLLILLIHIMAGCWQDMLQMELWVSMVYSSTIVSMFILVSMVKLHNKHDPCILLKLLTFSYWNLLFLPFICALLFYFWNAVDSVDIVSGFKSKRKVGKIVGFLSFTWKTKRLVSLIMEFGKSVSNLIATTMNMKPFSSYFIRKT